jgi:tetratricopeptide (TPR) repeat protein
MKILNRHPLLATVLTALLLNVVACHHHDEPRNKSNSEEESPEEAMVEAAAEAGDIKRTIELADSFVNLNLLSSVRADFYKAMVYNRQEDDPAMAEHIKKIIKAYEEGTDEDPLFYSRAAMSLAGHYIGMNQYEEAMNVAMPALAKFEPDPAIQPDWKGIFLSIIGACQKMLNQPEEAEQNFEQAYRYYKKYMGDERFKLVDFQTCIVDVYNISSYYSGNETLKEYQKWNDRCDSLLATRLFHSLASQGMPPAKICNYMNDELTIDNEQGMFVTMFIGLIDLTTGHLCFCNAGHNPPVIGGSDNKGDFLNMLPNAPIGLWPGLEYEGEEIGSIKSRPLFIYTDGLNEAEDRHQKQFGDDRMLDILRQTQFISAKQVIETMAEAVSQYRNGAEPNDDLSMMCICLKEPLSVCKM